MSRTGSTARENSIAIAGAGIIGMSLAWRLAQSGWQVSVFDKGEIGGESSWAGAGMLSPGGEIEGPSRIATLATESRKLYCEFVRELEQSSGLAIDYQECGALDLAYSQEEMGALEVRAARQAGMGIPSKSLTTAYVSTFWPRVQTSGLVGARFYPEDAIVNPREVVAALEAACRKNSVSVTPRCPVSRVEVSDAAVKIHAANGIETYKAVVIAAGAWSDSITATGVPAPPVSEPVKGHLIGYLQPAQTCNTIVRCGHTYLLQRANGLLIAGASVEHVGFDRAIQPEMVAHLTAQAGHVFPHLLETMPSEVWTGLRPGGDAPHIGSWHSPRLYLAYGHYRNGILLAPVTAQRLAMEINSNLGKRSSVSAARLL